MIRRLLIANRGEIAIRVICACRELGIESVAVYSDADKHAPHAVEADRAVAIGPAPAGQSYLSIPRVLAAAASAGADAVHPGYGFLSENASFAGACADAGLVFVGPPAAVIARMGSKIEARAVAAGAGVPTVPGETPKDQSDDGLRQAIERVGLPALVKASAGGGGRGMRRVHEAGELLDAVQSARREAAAAFGDGTLYVERLLDKPHHVEVQIFADDRGQVVHLFERECSVQRRHQKVIEESPSPLLSAAMRSRVTDAAVAVARAAGYRNAGTIEFLVAPGAKTGETAFYFLEMNTRLQVEHPVTEQVAGVDLVRAQLLVASGDPLPWTQAALTQRGHAIEARVYAEDPAQSFLPQAGRLTVYREPQAPGIRIDSGVAEGSEIPVYYDPLIAKVIATAETRDLAARRLAIALRRFAIAGVRTNVAFLAGILELPEFLSGSIDTGFLDREAGRLTGMRNPESEIRIPQSGIPTQSAIPNPQSSVDPWDGPAAAAADRPPAARPPVDRPSKGVASHATAGISGRQALAAPMPATVIKVNVKPGDRVQKGDVVLVLEAMKMELPIRAPSDAVVAVVRCQPGDLVQPEAVLVELS